MSFLSALGKIGSIASLAAIPFTGGLSALGIGGLKAGSKVAELVGKVGKVGNIASKVGTVAGGMQQVASGGLTPEQVGKRYAALAEQLARNRAAETGYNQRGMASDAQAMANAVRAGRLASYAPPSATAQALFDKYGRRTVGVDPGTVKFASTMQNELNRRIAAGQPLTLSGVAPKTAQELDAEKRAQSAAGDLYGGGVLGGIRKGADIAGIVGKIPGMFENPDRWAGGLDTSTGG